MALRPYAKEQFEKLVASARAGRLAIVEVSRRAGNYGPHVQPEVAMVCDVERFDDDGDYLVTPLAVIAENPFQDYSPPAGVRDISGGRCIRQESLPPAPETP